MNSINFGGMVDIQVRRRPDSPAVISPDGVTTYAGLARMVHAVAAHLAGSGVHRGDRVILLGYNSVDYIAATLAVYRLGAVAVPLNYRLQQDELVHLVNDCRPVAAVADAELVEMLNPALEKGDVQTRLSIGESADPGWRSVSHVLEERADQRVPLAEVDRDDLQRIMYTSGTTSRPKGVMVTHGMTLLNTLVAASDLGIGSTDRVLIGSPLYHVAAQDAPGLCTLFLGGSLVLMRKFDPELALQLIHEHGVTGGIFVQSMLHALRDSGGRHDLGSVRWMMFGAASGELYRDVRTQFPSARLIQSYGMTEACSMIATVPATMVEAKYGTAGTAVPFMEYKVVGPSGDDLPPGEAGEIVLRGPKVTPGYWEDESRTREAWQGGWFHTGDVGVVDEDGYIAITDRLKDMIRSGGENVASAEIERVIYEHPHVQEVAVVGVPDPRWQEVPKAFVVPKEGAELTGEDVIAHCRQRLAGFKTPKHVEFLSALPRNPSGKVLKRELRG